MSRKYRNTSIEPTDLHSPKGRVFTRLLNINTYWFMRSIIYVSSSRLPWYKLNGRGNKMTNQKILVRIKGTCFPVLLWPNRGWKSTLLMMSMWKHDRYGIQKQFYLFDFCNTLINILVKKIILNFKFLNMYNYGIK